MKTIIRTVAALCLCAAFISPAAARDNDKYGETRFNELPTHGSLSKTPWVGSWWAYGTDGLAYRVHEDHWFSGWKQYAQLWDRWTNKEAANLSPAEKYDTLVGRADKIEYEPLLEKAKKFDELRDEVGDLILERRTLIRKLNAAIRENADDSSFNWQDTEDGKKYLEVTEQLEEKQQAPDDVQLTVDTAFEYEVLNHGTAQFGVEGWYGHCNAWAAAAIMEPEPRHSTTVEGIEFTAGDVKSYITEAYMEIHSSFHGSRNEYHEDEESRDAVDFQDVTPAGFHILFGDLVGKRDKGFVIDRYTGSQVWNQPVRAYRADISPLYEGEGADAQPMQREVVFTKYGYNGAETDERGSMDVYPVLVTTTIHWMTDGLPHETLTNTNINDEIDDDTFADGHDIEQMWGDQVHLRTLTYELWLDKPVSDADARIVGDGAWQHGSVSDYAHLHPDFIWVPLANVNNSGRDYENEYIDYDHIVETILPGSLEAHDDPAVEPTDFTASGPLDIPDNDTDTGASLELEVSSDATINVLTVDVEVTHTWKGDLEVALIGPDGRVAILKEFGTGGSGDDVRETFDVKEFDGGSAQGTWKLRVRDQWSEDTGTIDSFTLHVK